MRKEKFTTFLKAIYDYYDRMHPKKVQADLWFSHVEKIPDEALDSILKELCTADSTPKNLPKAMWGAYADWKRANSFMESRCECHEGFWELCAYLPGNKSWAVYSIPCGRCQKTIGPRCRFDLLDKDWLQREPSRLQAEPPEWGLILPDEDSTRVFKDRIKEHLAGITPRFDMSLSERSEMEREPDEEPIPF